VAQRRTSVLFRRTSSEVNTKYEVLAASVSFNRISFCLQYRRPYNLYCVGADVKPCSINQFCLPTFCLSIGSCNDVMLAATYRLTLFSCLLSLSTLQTLQPCMKDFVLYCTHWFSRPTDGYYASAPSCTYKLFSRETSTMADIWWPTSDSLHTIHTALLFTTPHFSPIHDNITLKPHHIPSDELEGTLLSPIHDTTLLFKRSVV